MFKDTISKLYNFIIRLVLMLEDKLDEVKSSKFKTDIIAKKNLTETLHKLVNLIIVLNKLSKEESCNGKLVLLEEDKVIINSFLKNYIDKDK